MTSLIEIVNLPDFLVAYKMKKAIKGSGGSPSLCNGGHSPQTIRHLSMQNNVATVRENQGSRKMACPILVAAAKKRRCCLHKKGSPGKAFCGDWRAGLKHTFFAPSSAFGVLGWRSFHFSSRHFSEARAT